MVLVVLACLNALFYMIKIAPQLEAWDQLPSTPAMGKIVGAASLVLWFGVTIFGRLIPYVGTG